MPEKRQSSEQAKAEARHLRPEREEQSGQVRNDRPAIPAPALVDARLGHPANVARRAVLLRSGQQALGNQTVRRLLRTPPATDAALVQRQPAAPTDAGRTPPATRTGSQPWAILPAEVRQTITRSLASGARAEGMRRLVEALNLPLRSRITVELTPQVGLIDGVTVSRDVQSVALVVPYVLAKPQCLTAAAGNHMQLHQASEMRVHIQLSPRALRGEPDEQFSGLYSSLMHEYIHVEQEIARGPDTKARLVTAQPARVGAKEFFFPEETLAGEAKVERARHEIEASASEIENAERTGMARFYGLASIITNLWDFYCEYQSEVNERVERPIANRAYRAIQLGRQMFRRFLETPAAEKQLKVEGMPWAETKELLYSQCPGRYDAGIIEPYVDAGVKASFAAPARRTGR